MAEDASYLRDLSSVSPSASGSKRDMAAELLAWKQEKASREAQKKAGKCSNLQPFRVPRTNPVSPTKQPANTSVASSENVPCSAPSKAKTPSKTGSRSALSERSPNTEHLGNRSVSPVKRSFEPAPRSVRTKTPERTRPVTKTPEAKVQPSARRVISPAVAARPPVNTVRSARSPRPAHLAAVTRQAIPAAPAVVAVDAVAAVEAVKPVEAVDAVEAVKPVEAALDPVVAEVEDSLSPGPAPTAAAAAADAAEVASVEELSSAEALNEEPSCAEELQEEVSKVEDEAEELVQPSSLPTEVISVVEHAGAPAESASEPLSPASANESLVLASPPPTSGGSLLAAYLPAGSPGSLPSGSPCASFATGASPSVAARVGGGLLAAYEEQAGLPKMPPPSPATPSAALAFARATAAEMPNAGVKLEVAEFARAAGAALGRLAAEDPLSSPTPAQPQTPGRVEAEDASCSADALSPLSLESQSPERSRVLSPAASSAGREDIHEVKLEC